MALFVLHLFSLSLCRTVRQNRLPCLVYEIEIVYVFFFDEGELRERRNALRVLY